MRSVLCLVWVATVLFLADKLRLFGTNTILAAALLRNVGRTSTRNAVAGRGDAPAACGSAPYVPCISASGHIPSDRTWPGRWEPERGRNVSWDGTGWVGLQECASEPEVALPTRVRDPVPSRPLAAVPGAAHAAVPMRGARGTSVGPGGEARSATHLTVAPLISSARAFGSLSDDASDVRCLDFACGAGRLADNLDVRVCTFAHRCGHTEYSGR